MVSCPVRTSCTISHTPPMVTLGYAIDCGMMQPGRVYLVVGTQSWGRVSVRFFRNQHSLMSCFRGDKGGSFMSVVSHTIFSQIPQPVTHRSYHTLLPTGSRITSATVGIFPTFRLVLAPPHPSCWRRLRFSVQDF